MDDTDISLPSLPDGNYAIVELLGHRTLIGRIEEVERFGTKMIQVEPVYQARLLGLVLHGGSAIYGLTPCSRELAASKGATSRWQLPEAIRAQLPVEALPAPEEAEVADDDDDGDDGRPF